MSDDALPVQPGDTLANKYRVDRVLGSGGMGVVVAATHVELGQRVALKFLLPAALLNPEAVARFLREARAAVKIVSEHVARVSDVGRLENGAPYMVMEYLDGTDLASCAKGHDLPIARAVDYVLQACEAIAIAHALGIVHRDLKPANLFLTNRSDGLPLVKVLDFGISKLLEPQPAQADLTRTTAVMGSPLYMSPEQMRSARNVDVRTDVWALGTILHELLTGSPPFSGESLGEVFAAVMTAEPPRLRHLRPEAPERLEQLVLHALEKDPERRFPNVGAFAMALGEFASGESLALVERVQATLDRAGVARSTPPTDLPVRPTSGVAATDTSWATPSRSARGSTPILIAVAAVGLLLLGGFALLRRAPAVAPAPAPSATGGTSVGAAPKVAPAQETVATATPAPIAADSSPVPVSSAIAAHPIAASQAPSRRPSPPPPAASPANASPPSASTRSNPAAETKPRNPLSIDFK